MAASTVRAHAGSTTLPRWMSVIVILGALGVLSLAYGAIFAPANLLESGQHMNDAAHVWARYAAAYSVALGLTLLALTAVRAGRTLAGVLVQAALAEVLLGVVGIVDKRWEQVGADVVLVAVFLLGASRLLRGSPWRPSAWRDDRVEAGD
jgi:hypothetical protein